MYLAFPVSSGRFTQAIRVPGYSGTAEERCSVFAYGTVTLCGRAFRRVPLTEHFVTFPCRCRHDSAALLPPTRQRRMRFGLLPFRSPLLRELCRKATCFLFLGVLRCFTSPGTLRAVLTTERYSLAEWVSPFGNLRFIGCVSPRRSLSQTSRVLHRHVYPRHPPDALTILHRKLITALYPSFVFR